MRLKKQDLHEWVESLPESVDLDEALYRLHLYVKLMAAEDDVRAGRTLTHEEVVHETAKWR